MTGALEQATPVRPVEAELVGGARRGDCEAWSALVRRYTPLLWATAGRYRLSQEDRADAVQTTWQRCVQNLGRLREPASVSSWLVTTCRRECLVTLRRNGRTVPADSSDLSALPSSAADGDLDSTADAVVAREESAVVRAAVARLPDRNRRLLQALLDDGGHPGGAYANIATSLEMPIGSIGPSRMRALDQLRRDPTVAALRGRRPAPASRSPGSPGCVRAARLR